MKASEIQSVPKTIQVNQALLYRIRRLGRVVTLKASQLIPLAIAEGVQVLEERHGIGRPTDEEIEQFYSDDRK
jgi:hypothetical protein